MLDKNLIKEFTNYLLRERNCIQRGQIFHYTNINSFKSIIENKTFRATKSKFLNDKSEIIYFKKVSYEYVNTFFNSMKRLDNIKEKVLKGIDNFFDKINTDLFNNTYILSFSLNQDSLALWSNYNNYEGYVIGFNYFDFLKNFNLEECSIKIKVKKSEAYNEKDVIEINKDKIRIICAPVLYSDEKVQTIISESLNKLIDIYKYDNQKNEENFIFEELKENFILHSMFIKNKVLNQEDEFRIIFQIDEDIINEVEQFYISKGLIIPFI